MKRRLKITLTVLAALCVSGVVLAQFAPTPFPDSLFKGYARYTTERTLTDSKDFAYKKYVDDRVSAAGVTTFNGRNGTVTPQSGDYTKSDVGLGNVANVDTTNASNISSGTLGTARLGSGSASSSTFLRGDQSWATIDLSAYVPITRTVSTTLPLSGGGALSSDLTISINAATTSAAGSMSAADKATLDALAASTNWIYQPGGVASGRVYTDWNLLWTAVLQTVGPQDIYIFPDASEVVLPARTGGGAYDFGSRIALHGQDAAHHFYLRFDCGVTVAHLNLIGDSIALYNNCTTTPTWDITSGTESLTVGFYSGITWAGNGYAPFVKVSTGATLEIDLVREFATLSGTNGGEPIQIVGGTVSTFEYAPASSTSDRLVKGSTGTYSNTKYYSVASSSRLQTSFSGTKSSTVVTGAYAPSTPANWPVPPTNVGDALDGIANSKAPKDSPALTGTPTFGGSTSGTTGLKASATASGTLTLPAATDTLVGKATTDILTNKTLTTPTIGDLTNATHTHQNAAGGGTLDAAAIAAGTLSNSRLDAELAAWAGLTSAADTCGNFTGSGTASTYSCTAGGRAFSGLTGAADTCGYWTSSSAASTWGCGSAFRAIGDGATSAEMAALVSDDVLVWMPDAPPTSPHASNYEGGSVSAFTEWDFGSRTIAPANTGGHMVLAYTSNGTTTFAGATIASPASEFAVYAKVSLVGANVSAGSRAGFAVFQDATSSTGDLALVMRYAAASGNSGTFVSTFTQYNGTESVLGSQINVSPSYFRIRANGTTVSFDMGETGMDWQQIATTTLGYTPAQIGPIVQSSTTDVIAKVRFIRIFTGAGSSAFNANQIGREVSVYAQ